MFSISILFKKAAGALLAADAAYPNVYKQFKKAGCALLVVAIGYPVFAESAPDLGYTWFGPPTFLIVCTLYYYAIRKTFGEEKEVQKYLKSMHNDPSTPS